jgi:bidirectional [NiFe] hydrogenase diaphorase subunit
MLRINGIEYTSQEGATILELASTHGINIPTLCHHQALSPFGACRLCVVEITRDGRTKLDAACTYPASDGIDVLTDSSRVRRVRKMVLELLLARAPGVKRLHELAAELGVSERVLPVQDDQECILCGLCVRVCNEAVGKAAISFTQRGAGRAVSSPFNSHSEDCVGCTACAFVCPTGAVKVTDSDSDRIISTWHTEVSMLNCRECSTPFAPHKAAELLKDRLDLPEGFDTLCEPCRRKAILKTLGKFDFTSTKVFIKR